MDFSVIIPTYNGANKLPKVLDCLQEQININDLTAEIIIINNNNNMEMGIKVLMGFFRHMLQT